MFQVKPNHIIPTCSKTCQVTEPSRNVLSVMNDLTTKTGFPLTSFLIDIHRYVYVKKPSAYIINDRSHNVNIYTKVLLNPLP